ncbi:mucin-17-like [Venturia canescens]|uniref:mucin-17-like n=1 Tax=Venturia canescens TaxID=32260 RepID=UPI001C9D5335|nr:mucin-17-like [Venturia canescens]
MCDQTEINYLDGDIVWVKLGACWWPGQVTSFHNLPEDIQIEFQKKPLIAAVKFFQEDTYEFVKNLQQIYKYNCTQKDDFIRKGLDKYRTKSKDGSSYMDKFPGDVEMAEKLTGGDPDILTSEKFCREEKPDISALFGEKKIPKKKRDREEMNRRSSDGNAAMRKITHPRFLRESDHEIRIRQQPSSQPSTPKMASTDSPQYSCHLCNFTSTRVNVIICHRKSHCSDGGFESPLARGRITGYTAPKSAGRPSLPAETQKRKYVRKTKSLSSKGKIGESEPVKRKLSKQADKITAKKKKTDPELREKLLADWDDGSDEDMDLDANKSSDTISTENSSLTNNSVAANNSSEAMEEKEDDDGTEILKASEKLLRETEKFAAFHTDDSSSRSCRQSNNKHLDDLDSETDTSTSTLAKEEKSPVHKKTKKLIASTEDRKSSTSSEKDDKQSRFSCFDFDEEDLPEPAITPVRKIPRIFGEKNTSVKKEILKKFTLSQAMKSAGGKNEAKVEQRASEDKISANTPDFFDNKEPTAKEKKQDNLMEEKSTIGDRLSAKEAKQRDNEAKTRVEAPTKSDGGANDGTREKNSKPVTVTELEIVEIFEVEGEKDEREEETDDVTKKTINYEIETFSVDALDNKIDDETRSARIEEIIGIRNDQTRKDSPSREKNCPPEKEETMSELATTETEDETVSEVAESLRGNSENSDTDGNLNQATWSLASSGKSKSSTDSAKALEKPVPRRRGRPRKSLPAVDSSGNGGDDSPKYEIIGKKVAALASRDSERKTSESDSERSYSGRRRKPNKKYLHSELYTSSPDNRASKTDESQSETEEKIHKEHKGNRSRRGKKKSLIGSVEGHVESLENKNTDQEFEFYNRTLDAVDEATNSSKFQAISRVSEITEAKTDNMEAARESSVSLVTDSRKKLDDGIGSPVHITRFISTGDSESGSLKNIQDRETKNEKTKDSQDKCDKMIKPVTVTSEDVEMHANDSRSAPKLEPVKSSVDKLPPKKSQIKKFELSQIDLLDACEEQVAAEQAAAEKRSADEKLAAEKLVAEKLAAEKLVAEKIAAEKLAAEKLAAEKLAAEKLAAEKLAAEKLAAEKLAAEKLAAEKLAEEKKALEKMEAEKLAAEKLAAEKAEAERLAKEEEERKIAAEKKAAEEAKIAAEKSKVEGCDEKKLDDVNSMPVASSDQVGEMITQNIITTQDNIESVPVSSLEKVSDAPVTDSTMETIEAVLARITNEEVVAETSITAESKTHEKVKTSETSKVDKNGPKQASLTAVQNDGSQQLASQARFKGKITPEVPNPKKGALVDEEVPINSFQEAFLKTLHIDKKDEKEGESVVEAAGRKSTKQQGVASSGNSETEQTIVISIAPGKNNESLVTAPNSQEAEKVEPLNAMTEFEGVEILVQDNIVQVETRAAEEESSQNQMDLAATLVGSDLKQEATSAALSLDLQKIQDTLSDRVSTPSPSLETSVPVKKREKPRIIENVALKEPMQILKNKLLEKLPSKSAKHKLDAEGQKKGGDPKGSGGAPRAKIMKMESPSGNSKTAARSPTKTGGSQFTITRKLQVLKAEEAATAAAIEKEKAAAAQAQLTQTITLPTGGEKFIQQSSQSLADMELDINSMPFVLSEDVLTPESIERMPVVLSSIIPSSSTSAAPPPATSLALATTAQLQTSNSEVFYKSTSTSETTTTESSTMTTGKKKSGTPAILKNKAKAKPTITSIKTLVPPFSSGSVKGLKFQGQQSTSGKAMPLMSQKSATPGKYVIVQTAGGQQMRYSVQGKTGLQHKIAIPAGKATGSAQIVSQGGKVVILTSAQSGQTKMLPLNISKSMSGKVQKIVNNKGQIYAPISPQGIIGQKAIIAPKADTNSPTTSKIAQGQKVLNAQGIITSKGVLTPISTSKSGLLTTLTGGILTKGGIITPISSAQLGKTIIGGKGLVSSKGTTILSPLGAQTLGSSKGTIITPMTHTVAGKTIINAQGLVTPKGTVLTPITGQQVKAIAAKTPAKGAKIHYQPVQHKLQLPMLQKCQKIPVSSSSQVRAAAGSIKSPSGTLVFQNTVASGTQKSPSPGAKKIVRQIAQQTIRSPQTTTLTTTTTNVSIQQQPGVQRAKSFTATTPTSVQRVTAPRATGRQAKPKMVVQKISDATLVDGNSGASPITNTHSKPIMSPTVVGNVAKTPVSTKQTARTLKTGSRNIQKNLLNVSSTSSASPSSLGSSETLVAGSAPIQQQVPPSQPIQSLPVPPLVIPGTELPITEAEASGKIDKNLGSLAKEVANKAEPVKPTDPTIEQPKLETTKVTAQPQIMALPTESSDGTQTYVLVTIDEQGQIQPLDNNTLMSLEGTTQNADGTRTLYIDPSSLGEAGTLDNLVIQFDNAALPNIQANAAEASQTIVAPETTFPSSEIIQTSNQDILAAALANTDFQQEIGLPDNATSTVMTTGLTQTSLINQTILQSTIIPPTEPISSPSVLETSLTLNQPIMTPLEVPSSLPIQIETTPASVVSTIPTSLELPITITDPTISYISAAAAAAAPPSESHIQLPGNSMPDIGEIMESSAGSEIVRTDIPTSTRYLVLPTVDEGMTAIESQEKETCESPSVTYSVSIPDSIVIDNSTAQTTPSMPIIDDGYVEATEQRFSEVTVNEMLVSKAPEPEGIVASEKLIDSSPKHESNVGTSFESQVKTAQDQEEKSAATVSQVDSYVPQDVTGVEQMVVEEETIPETKKISTVEKQSECNAAMQVDEQCDRVNETCSSVPAESCSSEMQVENESSSKMTIESTEESRKSPIAGEIHEEVATNTIELSCSLMRTHRTSLDESSFVNQQEPEQINSSKSLDSSTGSIAGQAAASAGTSLAEGSSDTGMVVEEAVEMEIYPSDETPEIPDGGQQTAAASSQAETMKQASSEKVEDAENVTEASQQEESPSQSYEQFNASEQVTSDSTETPSQSATKSESSREATQSVAYEAMEVDENIATGEPPTQSFEDTKRNEASQSYEPSVELNTNAPTQSFNEIMQCQQQQQQQQHQQQQQQQQEGEEPSTAGDPIDDQSFPTQSYEVDKIDNHPENLESDASSAIGQEGNIPSQSNDIGNDGIGTSSVSINNSGLNEDETASSSYVPETPENQERDQDQESAISTSSYEIPPCEELNIASSSVIPDTSVRGEHMSIHDNGVPEIPTSSYNLNPDSSSTSHVDTLPTSSYEEDQVIVEQNVSTSYEVPISMPGGIEENSSQNFVTESTDHRNEPTSYYARHPEVSASYYEAANQDSNSRLEADPQEEVTPSYYEQPQDITSEASQSYFRPTPRYSARSVSPSYYEPTPETEASQSSYYSHEIETREQSSSRNVEASQSFYQETSDERRLRQQGEATPTYTERYPVDYALANSPIERHDLVESSVPATRPTERDDRA